MDNDPIDKKLTDYLTRRPGGERSLGLSPEDCYRYLAGEMGGEELERFLKALRSDTRAQELLAAASADFEPGEAPAYLKKKAKALWGSPKALCPHCGKSVTALKKPLGAQAGWVAFCAAGFLVSFALSFYVHRYFIQLLVLAGVFAFKAIIDLKAVRTQILVYKALSDEPAARHSRDLHNHRTPL